MATQGLGQSEFGVWKTRRQAGVHRRQVLLHVYALGQEVRQENDARCPLSHARSGAFFNPGLGKFQVRGLDDFELCRRAAPAPDASSRRSPLPADYHEQ